MAWRVWLLVLILTLLVLACAGRHAPAIVLPTKGVDVEVKVKVGKDALGADPSAPCRCATAGVAHCCRCRGTR